MASNFLTNFCYEAVTRRLQQATISFLKAESSGEKEGGDSAPPPWGHDSEQHVRRMELGVAALQYLVSQ